MVQNRLKFFSVTAAFALTSALAGTPLPVAAQQQQGQEWFVPGQARPPVVGQPRPPARPATPPRSGMPSLTQDGFQSPEQQPQQIQVQLPPAPEMPEVPKTPSPPAAVIGILSVPDVLRISTAYQQADKELGNRRQKLNEDAQKEEIALRDLGQSLAAERAKLAPEQIRARERDYQERVNASRRTFAERNQIIQEAGQYVMAQFDRTLEQVSQVVANSRGVNIVLNRPQILGTTADFDLTPQVAEVLNKVMPTVVIPPDGVSPAIFAPVAGAPPAAAGAKPPPKR